MSEASTKFESWAVLELFGHVKLAGWVTEQTVGGVHFLRIDIPECESIPAHTRFYTQGAVYGMSPVTEQVARALASRLLARPVQSYELPAPRLDASGVSVDDDASHWHSEREGYGD